jgi:hypothetical protein
MDAEASLQIHWWCDILFVMGFAGENWVLLIDFQISLRDLFLLALQLVPEWLLVRFYKFTALLSENFWTKTEFRLDRWIMIARQFKLRNFCRHPVSRASTQSTALWCLFCWCQGLLERDAGPRLLFRCLDKLRRFTFAVLALLPTLFEDVIFNLFFKPLIVPLVLLKQLPLFFDL